METGLSPANRIWHLRRKQGAGAVIAGAWELSGRSPDRPSGTVPGQPLSQALSGPA